MIWYVYTVDGETEKSPKINGDGQHELAPVLKIFTKCVVLSPKVGTKLVSVP
jgi:hypothetical protein